MSMYVYVNGVITISGHAPAGFLLTDDVNDVLEDIQQDVAIGRYAFSSNDLSVVCGTMRDRLGVSADGDDAVELLYSAISNPELHSKMH